MHRLIDSVCSGSDARRVLVEATQLTPAQRVLLTRIAEAPNGTWTVTVGYDVRAGDHRGGGQQAQLDKLVQAGYLTKRASATERDTVGRGNRTRQHMYTSTAYDITQAGREVLV